MSVSSLCLELNFLLIELLFIRVHRKKLRFLWNNRSSLFLTFRHLFVLSMFRIWVKKEWNKYPLTNFFCLSICVAVLMNYFIVWNLKLNSLTVLINFLFSFMIVQSVLIWQCQDSFFSLIESQWIPWIHQNPETVEMLLSQKNEKMAFKEKQQLNRKLPQNPAPNTQQKHIKRI